MLNNIFFTELSLTWVDLAAVLLFACGWIGYVYFAAWHGKRVPSLHTKMDRFRREWMVQMIGRDNRMVDVNVTRNVTRSSQFFASTTMLILGALLASMGYVQQAQELVSGLPFTVKASARLLEIKMLLLVLIFVHAFFKFSWAIRQLNFCGILVAAAPKQPKENPEQFAAHINRIARITSYAGSNFNHGLRSYYFAVAAMGWFLHPWLMVVATAWVISVLYHREFKSKTLHALVDEDASSTLKV
ncbi:MAG TPA: DUF599 domain-containing protein [Burkholderiales bacterium]|nr:DUF599 domain-containing protein [Burkholderiales bacterium]